MDKETKMLFELLNSSDHSSQMTAFKLLLESLERPVDWVYRVWDTLVFELESVEADQRAQAGQLLSYLAISDTEFKMEAVFPKIWQATYDQNRAVADTILQATWRIGLASPEHKTILLQAYKSRFNEAVSLGEKGEQICLTILRNMKKLYLSEQEKQTLSLLRT